MKTRNILVVLVISAMFLAGCGNINATSAFAPTAVTTPEPTTIPVVECPTQAPVNVTVNVVTQNSGTKYDSTPRIAVVSAFGGENDLVLAEISETATVSLVKGNGTIDFHLGTLRGKDVVVFVTETSMVNAAAITTMALENFNITAIVFTGISRGVDPKVNIGDVVIPDKWIEFQENYKCQKTGDTYTCPSYAPKDFAMFGMDSVSPASLPGDETKYWFEVDPKLFEAAENITTTKLESCDANNVCLKNPAKLVVGGAGGSSQSFVDNAEYREYLYNTFGLEVLEMEGAAVAHVAYLYSVPFIVIRANSDLAGGGDPDDKLPDGTNPIDIFWQIAAQNAAKVTLDLVEAYNP